MNNLFKKLLLPIFLGIVFFSLLGCNESVLDRSNERSRPVFQEINSVTPTQESVSFNIDVTDTDDVGTITAIELYQGETLIEALTDLSVRDFTGLLSNNEYQIKVTYTYDLNDGKGIISEIIELDILTPLFNGKGTQENPYSIMTVEDFKSLDNLFGEYINGYFIVKNNLDFTSYDYVSINNFQGVLDGNGHTLSNFKSDSFKEDDFKGLFVSNYGTIKNLSLINIDLAIETTNSIELGFIATYNWGTIKNVNIEMTIDFDSYGSIYLGAISASNYGEIIDIYSEMHTTLYSGGRIVVGGVASNNTGLIKHSQVGATILVTSSSSESLVGGIVGEINSGGVFDSFSNVDIEAKSLSNSYTYAGGIVGLAYGYSKDILIKNTYSLGTIVASNGGYRASAGGIAGKLYSIYGGATVEVHNSFSLADVFSNGDGVYRAGGITGAVRIGDNSSVVTINNFISIDSRFYHRNILKDNSSDIELRGIQYIDEVNEYFFIDILGWNESIWNMQISEENKFPSFIGYKE